MDINRIKELIQKIYHFIESLEKSNTPILPIERELLKGYSLELVRALEVDRNGTIRTADQEFQPEISSRMNENSELNSTKADHMASDETNSGDQNVLNFAENVSTNPSVEMKMVVAKKDRLNTSENPELVELFALKTTGDLADKLSMSPLENLTNAIGFNEKIYTINELFGGDQSLFNKTLDSLHKFKSMNEAKEFLITGVASQYEWTMASKQKKAANFIKLVHRLYTE